MKRSGLQIAFKRDFIMLLATTAIPVALQSLMSSSRTLVDVLMTSVLGTTDVAAIGYSSRITFVIILAQLGMANGGAVIIAQFWGAGKIKKARQATALTLLIGSILSLVSSLFCFVLAEPLISLATADQELIKLGAGYIKIVISMVVPFAVNLAFTVSLRSIGQARISTIFSLLGVILNIILNYLLIFGKLGFPGLGIKGAAWASLISTLIECSGILIFVYGKSHLMAVRAIDFKNGIKNRTIQKIIKVAIPLSISSVIWGVGILAYNIIVAHMGTRELAILSLISPIESTAIAIYLGLSSGSAMIVGHSLGKNDPEKTWTQANALLIWTIIIALFTSLIIFLSKDWVLSLYRGIDMETKLLARRTLVVLASIISFRAMNVTIMVGILRSGGDAIFNMGMDLCGQWIVAIPLTILTGLIWQLPLPIVFLAINSEEIFKFFIGTIRFASRKWMRNLVSQTH